MLALAQHNRHSTTETAHKHTTQQTSNSTQQNQQQRLLCSLPIYAFSWFTKTNSKIYKKKNLLKNVVATVSAKPLLNITLALTPVFILPYYLVESRKEPPNNAI